MSLTHRWEARRRLKELGVTLEDVERARYDKHNKQLVDDLRTATVPFKYYYKFRKNIDGDRSLRAIAQLCGAQVAALDHQYMDQHVFHLSRVFNSLIRSKRKLHKCYDCGTNARAAFIRLTQVARGLGEDEVALTPAEQKRISGEYWLNVTNPVQEAKRALAELKAAPADCVFLMSVGVQDFGHVWVIEKRFFGGQPRYHHYQSALRSHLLLDFLHKMDYGRNPMKSLNVDKFFADMIRILSINDRAWTQAEHNMFANLFAFLPGFRVTKPRPGFCFTHVTY